MSEYKQTKGIYLLYPQTHLSSSLLIPPKHTHKKILKKFQEKNKAVKFMKLFFGFSSVLGVRWRIPKGSHWSDDLLVFFFKTIFGSCDPLGILRHATLNRTSFLTHQTVYEVSILFFIFFFFCCLFNMVDRSVWLKRSYCFSVALLLVFLLFFVFQGF